MTTNSTPDQTPDAVKPVSPRRSSAPEGTATANDERPRPQPDAARAEEEKRIERFRER
jgi:hypothetical protein